MYHIFANCISALFALLILCLSRFSCDAAPNVIIVGAGAAGIAAASRLLQNNITDVVILEAESRIGGRIYSVKFGDAFIDLGAQWCHGEKDNIVYDMVQDLNLLGDENITVDYYYSSGEEIDHAFVDELYQFYQTVYYGDKKDDDTSIGDYITKMFNKYVNDKYANNKNKMRLTEEVLDVLRKLILSIEGAFSWFDISAEHDYEDCDGNRSLNWKGYGYKIILDILMQKYPNPDKQLPVEDKIFLNSEVIEIDWDNQDNRTLGRVAVKCDNGCVYYADHLIFTPSLGVLKENYETLFEPPLPNEKSNAIETLGFDAVFKVFLYFPVRWWPTVNYSDSVFIWSEKDRKSLSREFPNGPIKNGTSWLTDLMSVHIVQEENPNLLAAWFSGQFVPEIEKCSDNLLIDGIMFVMDRFLKDDFPNITPPRSIIRNNWYSNPHFRGTYSYQTIKSRHLGESPELILAKPLTTSNGEQTLLFAGEATHPIYYSTVHGAIETGFREAQRIIDIYK